MQLRIPTLDQVLCFLRRRCEQDDEYDGENEYMDRYMSIDPDDEIYDYEAENDEMDLHPVSFLDGEGLDDEAVWELAAMYSVHRFSPSWWLGGDEHGDDCMCRPVTLLEVLQDLVPAEDRQKALDAYLNVLHAAWDHFWSGDAMVRSNSVTVGGACPDCIVFGPEHLADVLDEARSLAEDLGEALAAFKTQIAIGTGRYNIVE